MVKSFIYLALRRIDGVYSTAVCLAAASSSNLSNKYRFNAMYADAGSPACKKPRAAHS
jgi:hypothetical protein